MAATGLDEETERLRRDATKRMPGIRYTWLYRVIRAFFHASVYSFYHTIHTVGIEGVGEHGDPTIVCFNHSNSLTDSAIVITRVTNRMVRFLAKDTLFKVPLWGHLIRGSGALPVQRRQDHGDTDNSAVFSVVEDTLGDGQCIGLAPEGTSRMRSYMTDLKTGTAHIALQAVGKQVAADPAFSLRICPMGITYLHREKWRSSVLVHCAEPIILTRQDFLEYEADKSKKSHEVTDELARRMRASCLDVSSWATLRLSIAAARLYKPLGTRLGLDEYIQVVHHFATVLGAKVTVSGEERFDRGELRNELKAYSVALTRFGLRDERVRWCCRHGGERAYWFVYVGKILVRLVMCLFLFAISIPGGIFWAPVFVTTKRTEWRIINRGKVFENGKQTRRHYNYDTLAENKMAAGFFTLMPILFLVFSVVWYRLGCLQGLLVGYVVLPAVMWLTMRWLEDAIAAARSMHSLFNLLTAPAGELAMLIASRNALETKISALAEETAAPNPSPDDSRQAWWHYFSLRRRRKRDWTEVLRLREDLTMLGAEYEASD